MMFGRNFVVISLLALAACSSDSVVVTASGSWNGTSTSQQHFAMTLAQSGQAVTGSAVIDPGNLSGQPFSATVTGAVTDDHIALTLDTGNGSVAFDGMIVDAHTMQGQLDGAGWDASPIEFTR